MPGCGPRTAPRLDAAARRGDAPRVTIYDELDWHYDTAIEAGQPEENAFTHIGLYLAWLIRHDLHDPDLIPKHHSDALKRGEMTGSDLADDIDGKLVGDVMTPEGQAFSDAVYQRYLADYATAFGDLPEYGVADDAAAYARIEPFIDRLYAEWVASGGPLGAPEPDADVDFPPPLGDQDIAALESVVSVIPPPRPDDKPHEAPVLERLLPTDLTDPPLETWSVSASGWGSSLLKHALTRLEVSPQDAVVVAGIGGHGEKTLAITLYAVRDVPADRLTEEFELVISLPPKGSWEVRQVAGTSVQWAAGPEATVAFWARDGLVAHVAGDRDDVERAVARLREI
jgi:hypothetical protein